MMVWALGMALLHWGKSVTGAPTPYVPEPMTNFMKLQLPTLMVATWKEFTIAVTNFKKHLKGKCIRISVTCNPK